MNIPASHKLYKHIRLFALFVALAFLLCACGKKEKEEEPGDNMSFSEKSNAPTQNNASPAPTGEPIDLPLQTGSPQYSGPGQGGSVSILDTAAYPFEGILYGGVAYKNNGNSPIVLQEATFTFAFSGGTQSSTFAPIAWENDVVLPGETAYCTLWLPFDGAMQASSLTLTAELRTQATAKQQRPLAVSSARIIQNYPRFATLSGRLSNSSEEASDLSMIYASFYDENERLLGVWFFPYNAVLQPGNGTSFVVHMESMPIPSLAERTKKIEFRAFSMI